MFQNDDQTGGGIYPQQEGETGLITYFNVDDIDSAKAKVEELGGKAEDKHSIPGMGWFARAEDTEGNAFSLWQSDENAPAEERQG
jgi:predicted enzyme related to lactoylglutathione lyase